MKRLALLLLSTVALWTVAVPTSAQNEGFGDGITPSTTDAENLSPVNLVQLAYQGYFEEQGIPSHAALQTSVASGKIDAETLVRSAIAKGRLAPNKIDDTGYLNIVRTHLENLNDRN
jgi:hypothetical protein